MHDYEENPFENKSYCWVSYTAQRLPNVVHEMMESDLPPKKDITMLPVVR